MADKTGKKWPVITGHRPLIATLLANEALPEKL